MGGQCERYLKRDSCWVQGRGPHRISSIIFSRKTSAGVFQPRHLRGVLLRRSRISLMSLSDIYRMSRFRGNQRLARRLVFSTVPEIKARKSDLSGTISLAVGQLWQGSILPQVIASMAAALPDVQFKIITGPRELLLERLRSGEVDLMLGRRADLPKGVCF